MSAMLLLAVMLMPGIVKAQDGNNPMLQPLPTDTAVRIGKLPNGLTYYIRHNEYPKGQADFYIAQKVGSILEEDNQRGLAHFLEHMCFNGTTNFPGSSLRDWLESIGVKFGANLNAYTAVDQTVYNISGLIDYKIFGWLSSGSGLSSGTISSLVGVYSSKYRLLCSVPIAVSTAVASSMIPSAVAAYTENDVEQWNYNISSGVKFNMIVAIPCAVGLMMLGQPIIKMLFSSSGLVNGQPIYVLGGNMLTAGAIAIVFYALSNVSGGALQSIDRMNLPVIHSAISLGLHVVLIIGLLKYTGVGIYALIIGNVTFPVVVFLLNYLAIRRYVPSYRQEIIKTFAAPFAAALWMAIAIALTYQGLSLFVGSNMIKTLVSIVIAVFVYFSAFLLLRGLTKEELFDFPMGRRLYILACKLHLMKGEKET